MTGEAATKSRWLWKVLASAVVVTLYFLPFYQKYVAGSLENPPHREIIPTPHPASRTEASSFKENFVNQARPGMMCHVSCIAVAGDDRLICTWYAGSREAAPDVAIYAAFFQENTGVWTEPQVLVDRHKSSAELGRWVRKLGNAVVMNDQGGGLWLFYASMLGGWSTASLNYKVSRDEGRTWSGSRRLILSPFFNLTNNVKNKGVNLSQGAFLLPVYHEFIRKFSQVLCLRPEAAIPDLHYELRPLTRTGAAIQPALIPLGEKSLAAFFRNAGVGENRHIEKAQSPDLGQHWSALTDTTLPNPDAGFDMLRLADGGILGAINNNFRDRSDLTLVLSRDEGRTWKTLRVLAQTPGKEYAYPSLTQTRRSYHVTYSYEKTRIKHVMFNDAWLQEQAAHDH